MLESLMVELQAQITPQAIFAILGGLMGACLIALPKVKHDGLPVSLVLIFFGTAMALVSSDIMLINLGYDRLGAHAALGTGVGCVGGAMMMTIRAISPQFADKIVNLASKAAIGVAESRFGKALALIFGK